ncbi:MAG: hypothetical protein K2X87_14985 [Gemmataceae bacterium]|nr:hypothetical protein [Gemmataceae bacterium]
MASTYPVPASRLGEWGARLEQFTSQVDAGDVADATWLDNALAEAVGHLDIVRGQTPQVLDDLEAVFDEYLDVEAEAAELARKQGGTDSENLTQLRTVSREKARICWTNLCDWLAMSERHVVRSRDRGRRLPPGRLRNVNSEIAAELESLCERAQDLIRYLVVAAPELDLEVPGHLVKSVWTFRIPPLAYLRAMWNLWWSAIRHPFSETTIDLSTGRVLYRT